MILKSLKLENIRSYLNQNVEFPSGSVLLSGDIGAGKSTILLALEFALFGTRRDLSGSSLLRHGKNEGSVELSFNIDGKDYAIKRRLKRSKDTIKQESGHIIHEGEKTEGTALELKTKILELLGYPEELLTKSKAFIYRYTVYTPQEEMKQILVDDAETRQNTLRRIFGIDKYKMIAENASFYIRSLREKQRRLEGVYADLTAKIKHREEHQQERTRLEESKKQISAELDSIREQLVKKHEELRTKEVKLKEFTSTKNKATLAENKVTALKSHNGKLNDWIKELDEKITSLQKKIDEINIDESKLEDVKKIDQEIESLNNSLHSLLQKEATFVVEMEGVNKQIKNIEEEIIQRTADLSLVSSKEEELRRVLSELSVRVEVEGTVEQTTKRIDNIKAEIKECEVNITLANKTKEKIASLDECPTCIQPVSSSHKEQITTSQDEKIRTFAEMMENHNVLLSKESEILDELKDKLKVLQEKEKSIIVLKSDLAKALEVKQRIASLKKSFVELTTEKESIQRNLKGLKMQDPDKIRESIKNKKDARKEYEAIMVQLQEMKHLRETMNSRKEEKNKFLKNKEQNEAEMKSLSELLGKLNEQVNSFKDVEKGYEVVKKEVDHLRNDEREVSIRKAKVDESCNNILRLIEHLEEDIKKKELARDTARNHSQLENWFSNHFVKLVNTVEKQIMSKIYRDFNQLFSTWFNALIEDEIIHARLDDEFTPIVEQNGYETNVENLSGGERTALALAYRLALNKVINDIVSTINTKDLIILDEPTDGFSAEQLNRVRDVLTNLGMQQTIIVSHENEVESFVENVIRIEKNEHVSNVL